MRTFILLLGLSLSNTSSATSASIDAGSASLQPSTEAHLAVSEGEGEPAQIDWDARYHAGQRLGQIGQWTGWFGVASVIGGLALLDVNGLEGNKEIAQTVAVSGLLSVWAGAGVAALGTSRERRALVQMGKVSEGCLGCLLAWGTVWNPFLALVSYPISAAQRRADARIYAASDNGQGDGASFHLAPVPTPSGFAYGVQGTF